MNHPKLIAALGTALLLAAPVSAQQVLDTDEAEIDVPDHPFGEVGAPGLGADRDVAPEPVGEDEIGSDVLGRDEIGGDEVRRGLDQQLSVGTVDDQQILPGGEEDVLSGAGVGLRENEDTIGTTDTGDPIGDPPAGFGGGVDGGVGGGMDGGGRSIMSDDGL